MDRKYPVTPIVLPKQESEKQAEQIDMLLEQKGKRRNKNDSEGRTYKCGCGKMYLSYPALYTHIKTKHEGITPEGTNAPQFKNGRGRGRPRKIKDTTAPVKIHVDHPSDNIRSNPDFADEISYLREIEHFYQDGTDPFENFPRLYANNQEIEHPLLKILREEDQRHEEARNGKYVKPHENTCERVLAKFLWEHAKVCDSEYYSKILKIIIYLYKYLDENVEEDYCSKRDCESLPCEMNEFMIFLEDMKMIDEEGDTISLIKHFAAWLYSHGYTHIPLIEN
ncbi:hypothetical protein SteCoe_7073 [Stentor coeruleus]|uniref:Uncharacterized protein n=1 Tax=Stentor coeruleus TaxID=5963 RepID=A0A1R2CAY3_9CILI|nr:hypothetical protein SteCoe_12428 [Stentor coeruleus]OMJ90576.1 hypothetical protein SteCoe_7073 [Stentor coeruleus]